MDSVFREMKLEVLLQWKTFTLTNRFRNHTEASLVAHGHRGLLDIMTLTVAQLLAVVVTSLDELVLANNK